MPLVYILLYFLYCVNHNVNISVSHEVTLYNLYEKSSPHPITVWALSQERWHVGDNGLFIWWDARHICEKKLQWFIWHWNVAGFCGWRACCSERVELHWDKPLSSIHLIFSFRSTVLPSGSSRGVTSRLRWAIVNASCRFSVGFLVRLSLRSTKSGFMDLIIARNARPFLQLLPKSFTSTPNLHVWNYKKMGVLNDSLAQWVWMWFRLTLMCISGPTGGASWWPSHGTLTPWQSFSLCLAVYCMNSCQYHLAGGKGQWRRHKCFLVRKRGLKINASAGLSSSL